MFQKVKLDSIGPNTKVEDNGSTGTSFDYQLTYYIGKDDVETVNDGGTVTVRFGIHHITTSDNDFYMPETGTEFEITLDASNLTKVVEDGKTFYALTDTVSVVANPDDTMEDNEIFMLRVMETVDLTGETYTESAHSTGVILDNDLEFEFGEEVRTQSDGGKPGGSGAPEDGKGGAGTPGSAKGDTEKAAEEAKRSGEAEKREYTPEPEPQSPQQPEPDREDTSPPSPADTPQPDPSLTFQDADQPFQFEKGEAGGQFAMDFEPWNEDDEAKETFGEKGEDLQFSSEGPTIPSEFWDAIA